MAAPRPGTDSVLGFIRRPNNNQAERGGPGKIRCFTNGEWKDRSEFSTRQLDRFKRSGASVANSQISCREHTAQVRRELKCEGPCGEWYPIEVFSRSTRSHSKTWCLHCTEWQLSVEPGYTPFNPPTAAELEDDSTGEARLLEAVGTDHISEEMSNRIVDWMQQSPSENGDPEEAPSTHLMGSDPYNSVVPSTSLLDDSPNIELDFLPVALSAANASRTDNVAPARMSYATAASTAPVVVPGLNPRSVQIPQMPTTGRNVPSNGQRPLRATASSDSSGETARAVIPNRSAAPPLETAWVENEFSALTVVDGTAQTHQSGWAKPNQRKTNLVTPRYVANSRGPDFQPQSVQKVTYAEDDDYDSGDEC